MMPDVRRPPCELEYSSFLMMPYSNRIQSGRFTFQGISNDPTTPYHVGARYQGVPYSAARVVFAPGELEREVEIRVAEVTDEAERLSVPLARLRRSPFCPRCQHLLLAEGGVTRSQLERRGGPRIWHFQLDELERPGVPVPATPHGAWGCSMNPDT